MRWVHRTSDKSPRELLSIDGAYVVSRHHSPPLIHVAIAQLVQSRANVMDLRGPVLISSPQRPSWCCLCAWDTPRICCSFAFHLLYSQIELRMLGRAACLFSIIIRGRDLLLAGGVGPHVSRHKRSSISHNPLSSGFRTAYGKKLNQLHYLTLKLAQSIPVRLLVRCSTPYAKMAP